MGSPVWTLQNTLKYIEAVPFPGTLTCCSKLASEEFEAESNLASAQFGTPGVIVHPEETDAKFVSAQATYSTFIPVTLTLTVCATDERLTKSIFRLKPAQHILGFAAI
jgi:hypothetical protein